MKVAIGSDHAGYEAKQHLVRWLNGRGIDVADLGTHAAESTDYPDDAARVAEAVANGEAEFGLLVCGSGIGMSIVANKFRGVRAAVCAESYAATLARGHNDANVLCLGARLTGLGLMEEIARAFLDTRFEGGRHARRVGKIGDIESKTGASARPAS